MRRKSFHRLLVVAAGLLAIVAATVSERSGAADGNCYAGATGPSTPTICN
jgi:hypothetical protein